MKFLSLLVCSVILATPLATKAEDSDSFLDLLPSVKNAKALTPKSDNPFHHIFAPKLTDGGAGGFTSEKTVSQLLEGKGIGGIIPASKYCKGGAIIANTFYEIGDELLAPNSKGEMVPLITGRRIFLRGASLHKIDLEVFGTSESGEPGSAVSFPVDEYFRQ